MKAFLVKTICCGSIFLNFSPAIAQTPPAEIDLSPKNPRQFLQLIDAGVEPRRELKFLPAVNSKQSLTMNVEFDTTMLFGSRSPASSQNKTVRKIDLNIKRITANGDIDCEYVYTQIDIAPTPAMSADLVRGFRTRLATAVGTRGNMTFDRRGQLKKQTLILPPKIDPNMKTPMESDARLIEIFSTLLPSDKIGKGAIWRLNRDSNIDNINVEQIITYKVVELSERQVTIESNIQQTAPSQSMFDGLMKLRYATMNGKNKSTFRLDSLLPTASTFSSNSKSKLETASGKNDFTIEHDTKFKMEMTSP